MSVTKFSERFFAMGFAAIVILFAGCAGSLDRLGHLHRIEPAWASSDVLMHRLYPQKVKIRKKILPATPKNQGEMLILGFRLTLGLGMIGRLALD